MRSSETDAGCEETTILGNIGPHSEVFPVGALDGLREMRDALHIPKASPAKANL